uniref:Mucin-19 n=1 Tax=Lygus hesperus TaxID=30085 RepID=A0A0A9X819_LYGHE
MMDATVLTECRPAAKMCGSTSSASDSQAKKKEGGKLRGRGRCTPGSTWIQNCIQCYCDEQQNVECVPEESCSDDQVASQSRNREEGPKGRGRCEPGSTWEVASRRGDWCNVCTCDSTGIMNCSIRPCQKMENTSKLESETRKKRSTLARKRSERWCKPGDMYYFTCNVCPCGLKGITGCNARTCRDRAL